MVKLKKEERLKVAVTVDGKPYITSEEGVLAEYVGDDVVYLYIRNRDETKEVKVKIEREESVPVVQQEE